LKKQDKSKSPLEHEKYKSRQKRRSKVVYMMNQERLDLRDELCLIMMVIGSHGVGAAVAAAAAAAHIVVHAAAP
jgi:hypothetical protein